MLIASGCCGPGSRPEGGRLVVLSGTVKVVRATQTQTLVAKQKHQLATGDAIMTRADSEALIDCAGFATILRPGSQLIIHPRAPRDEETPDRVDLLRGVATFLVPIAQPSKKYRFEATANGVVAAVRGTMFDLEAMEDGRSIVTVLRGEVDLKARDGTEVIATVSKGDHFIVPSAAAALPLPMKLSAKETKTREASVTAAILAAEALGRPLALSRY